MNNICENCGCSHDGSYGSGRFCSKSCRMSYISKQNHSKRVKSHKTGPKARGGWKCAHCSMEFRTRRDKEKHSRDMHYGGVAKLVHAWNYGLNKQTNLTIAHAAMNLSRSIRSGERSAPGTLFEWTDDRRQQQSERKKQLYQEHPEKHPNRKCAGNRSKMTYPERIAYEWLNDYGFNPIHNYYFKTDRFVRYVDFYIPRLNLFIEIDGEHWHTNIELDMSKDMDARNHGFYTLRIRPKIGVCNQLIEYFSDMRY